jgi:DNA polymerase, archaea type
MPHEITGTLCGLWIDDAGRAHTCYARMDGSRDEQVEEFKPFAWLATETIHEGVQIERLKGEGVFNWLAHADSLGTFELFFKQVREGAMVDVLKPYESQWLLQRRQRLYAELPFQQLRRCQLDIETGAAEAGAFSDARLPNDRVLAIGLQCGHRRDLLTLDDESDAGEKRLLLALNETLRDLDPDVIEGHNIFKFDFDYLRQRSRRHKVPCAWGRFGQPAEFRNSRMKVAERWIDFTRCDLPGRAVIDTYLLVQLYDITAREMTAYGLKDVAVYFGITPESGEGRTYIDGAEIQMAFRQNRESFLAYLADDLRETKGLADVLLPTYFEQARAFPLLLQEAALRGTAGKVDLLFLEEYYHARAACPAPIDIAPFEGGFTRSFQEGVFKHVLHFDVASLYPSLLLQMNRNPKSDSLGVFIPMLRRLREYRLKYKQLAKTAPTAAERDESQARQATFKILINSFYGYLGFSGARFGDGELAAEVTRRGRELLQALIAEFQKHDCVILEADTDGIYLSTESYFQRPEELLAEVEKILPPGIELEYDGSYDAMFCYKAKNYALAAGGEITLRGSALRSRGIEPFLKRLSDHLIAYLLGTSTESPLTEIERMRGLISGRQHPVADLAKSESLSQNPAAYEQWVAGGGKPRRAAAEVALRMNPRPRMGERVSYYIGPREKGQTSDWQRARPLGHYDPVNAPYAVDYYLVKLDDWLDRYGRFLGIQANPDQQEMIL